MMLAALEGNQKRSFVSSISTRKVGIRPKFYESANILSFIAKPLVNRIAELYLSVDSLYKHNFMILETLEGTPGVSRIAVKVKVKIRRKVHPCVAFLPEKSESEKKGG